MTVAATRPATGAGCRESRHEAWDRDAAFRSSRASSVSCWGYLPIGTKPHTRHKES
jgi:hypothetical protein